MPAGQGSWPSTRVLCGAGALLGVLLWVANHLFLLAAFVRNDARYEPLLGARGQDTATYFSWIKTLAGQWTIPDYFAPWHTEPAHRIPLMWMIGQVNRLLELSPGAIYVVFHIALYAITGAGFLLFLRRFTRSRRDALLSVGVMLCILPTRSFLLLPVLWLRPQHWRWSAGFDSFAGGAMGDGFLLGLSASLTVSIGTTGVLIGLLLIGRYLDSRRPRELWTAALVNGLFTILHPYEFATVLPAGGLAILHAWGGIGVKGIRDCLILGLPSAAAVLFYVTGTASPWFAIAADLNRFEEPFNLYRLSLLGVPLLSITAGAALLGWNRLRHDSKDILLRLHLLATMTVFFLPFMPWPRLSGVYYVAGIVAIHLWTDTLAPLVRPGLWRKAVLAGAAAALLLAVIAHGYFRYASFRLGLTATTAPDAVSAVASVDERAVHAWLGRQPGIAEQLVLAPHDYAAWFALVPMHTFASHFQLGLTYPTQRELADRFFHGSLPAEEARTLLARYGIGWILLPAGNTAALPYLRAAGARERFRTPTLVLYEIAGAVMHPLPKLTKVAPGRYEWLEAQ